VADVQEFREENSEQFEHQMRINSKAGGNLPDLASRQGNAEVQEDLLTGSGAGSDTDSPSMASHDGAPVMGCHACKSPAQRGHMRRIPLRLLHRHDPPDPLRFQNLWPVPCG
jgi:hypothetical protein